MCPRLNTPAAIWQARCLEAGGQHCDKFLQLLNQNATLCSFHKCLNMFSHWLCNRNSCLASREYYDKRFHDDPSHMYHICRYVFEVFGNMKYIDTVWCKYDDAMALLTTSFSDLVLLRSCISRTIPEVHQVHRCKEGRWTPAVGKQICAMHAMHGQASRKSENPQNTDFGE